MIGLILAAGKGTRMSPYTDAVPKEILPVAEIPVIEYSIRYLGDAGVNRIYIVLGNKKASLIDYIKDGKWLNVHVTYLYQDMRHGTGTTKAIEVAQPWIREDFIVFYGDSFFHPGDFVKDIISFHRKKKASVTMGLYAVSNPTRFGIAKINPEGALLDLIERPSVEKLKELKANEYYLANSGPLIFKPEVFDYIVKTKPAPDGEYWITETIRLMLKYGRAVYGFQIPLNVFWRDIGTPEARLEADEYALKNVKLSKEI